MNNNKLVSLAISKLGCGYVWGAQGEFLTAEKLKEFENSNGIQHYVCSSFNAENWIDKQCFDCSGLVLWCLQKLGCVPEGRDYNAEMLYHQLCTPISREELKPGDLVFISANGIDHVGIYQGEGKTIEAKGTAYGVVEGDASRFDLFGRLKFNLDEQLDWKGIIEKVASKPVDWEKGIQSAVNAAAANGDLGDLEIFKFLPDLIVKVYNAK